MKGALFISLGQLGPLEIVIILVVILIIFGGRKIPELGKDIGNGIREFRHDVFGRRLRNEDPVPELRVVRRKPGFADGRDIGQQARASRAGPPRFRAAGSAAA